MKLSAAAIAVVMVGLVAAGCTDTDQSPDVNAANSSAASAGTSSMTFEEAYQRVPIDGVGDLKISWELPPEVDDEVSAARRSLAYNYWLPQATDWNPIIPIGRFLFTDWWYQQVLSKYETNSGASDPSIGPIWIKFMGTEQLGQDQVKVTFCTDIGWWHRTSESDQKVREDRANLESLIMHNVQTGDGERRWLTNQHFNPAGEDQNAKYGAECTKWARHKP
jgi:hypothetical protein